MKGLALAAALTAFAIEVIAQSCPAGGVSTSAVSKPPGMKAANVPHGCVSFEILVARGTGEYDRNASATAPAGKFGIVVGDHLVDGVLKSVPSARGYPVQYPASVSATSASTGSADVTKRISQMSEECPKMKFAIVGYSQGAQVMHSASNSIGFAKQKNKILAAVMFGDPLHKSSSGFFSGIKSMNVCNAGNKKSLPDPVCAKSTSSFCFDAHVHYMEEQFMGPAIEFVVKAFKGIAVHDKAITGNEPFKADPSLVSSPQKFKA